MYTYIITYLYIYYVYRFLIVHVSSTLRQESLPRFRYRLATGIYRHAGERKREGETERERERQTERERES